MICSQLAHGEEEEPACVTSCSSAPQLQLKGTIFCAVGFPKNELFAHLCACVCVYTCVCVLGCTARWHGCSTLPFCLSRCQVEPFWRPFQPKPAVLFFPNHQPVFLPLWSLLSMYSPLGNVSGFPSLSLGQPSSPLDAAALSAALLCFEPLTIVMEMQCFCS